MLAGLFALASYGWCELTPDQIVLVVNRNSPASIALGREYAVARNIPDGHTVELDLPVAEELDFNTYETRVVPPLRKFLRDGNLDHSTTCLVTFWGVPFRISAHVLNVSERKELDNLTSILADTTRQIVPAVSDLESELQSLKPEFKAASGETLSLLTARLSAVLSQLTPIVAKMPDSATRTAANEKMLAALRLLGGNDAMAAEYSAALMANASATRDAAPWEAAIQTALQTKATLGQLEEQRFDPAARAKMLIVARDELGLMGYAQLVQAQHDYLNPDQSTSALDNELSLLWWPLYGRSSAVPNALNWHFRPARVLTLMVMRLDAPAARVVSDMIHTSVQVEKTGLDGVVAIDARGIGPIDANGKPDGYGEYDQMLRDLAATLKAHSRLEVVLDNTPELFHPHQVKSVAVYCGWYSLRNYIPGCDFVPGAVGVHIASLEMVGLHPISERGWVHGLLNDGVVATMGAVDEPYLQAFPHPDEFFELLLTGKLTLAEVYWKTTPMASWMISAIGDPLYRPFAARPALDIADLPGNLRHALDSAATTQPSHSESASQ
jgi:uncharacterized protein (TIGR03790 family)